MTHDDTDSIIEDLRERIDEYKQGLSDKDDQIEELEQRITELTTAIRDAWEVL